MDRRLTEIPLPTDVDSAKAMAILGLNWLRENAPHELRSIQTDESFFEEALEAAFWEYGARKNGAGAFNQLSQSKRMAFKTAVRGFIATVQGHPKT